MVETFSSVQGEGINAGIPMFFIRLAGCNLRCKYCDTGYALDPGAGYDVGIDDLIWQAHRSFLGWVCITGGEPLLQLEDLSKLCAKLYSKGFKIEIETNGTQVPTLPMINSVETFVVDIKCPSSGYNSPIVLCRMPNYAHTIKFVVGTDEDLGFVGTLYRLNPKVVHDKGLVSPVVMDGKIDRVWAGRVAQFCVETGLRFSLQLHKVIWGDRRGV